MPAPDHNEWLSSSAARGLSQAGVSLVAVGIDTARLVWRPEDSNFWSAIRAAEKSGRIQLRDSEKQSGVEVFAAPIGGVCWEVSTDRNLLTCEGRIAKLLGTGRSLADRSGLLRAAFNAASAFQDAVGDVELPLPTFASRLDFAADLALPTSLGRSALQRLSEIEARRTSDAYIRADRMGPGSIEWENSRGISFRAYDVRRRDRQPVIEGTVLRLERQRRWDKDRQLPVEDLATGDWAHYFAGGVRDRVQGAAPLLTIVDTAEMILQRSAAREIKDHVASRLIGDALRVERDGMARWSCRRTRDRKRQQLAEVGIAITETEDGTAYCRPEPAVLLTDLIELGLRGYESIGVR